MEAPLAALLAFSRADPSGTWAQRLAVTKDVRTACQQAGSMVVDSAAQSADGWDGDSVALWVYELAVKTVV